MRVNITIIALSALLVGGCTSTLRPMGVENNYSAFSQKKQTTGRTNKANTTQQIMKPCELDQALEPPISLNHLVSPQDASKAPKMLDWLSCEMLAKSMANISQADSLKNRNEWRDIPLIGSALTIAALVLFGNRGADGNLTGGEVDVIEGFALGTAGFVALSDYLNPKEAADLLYISAEGHRCLAEHGQAAAAYSDEVSQKEWAYHVTRNARNEVQRAMRGMSDENKEKASALVQEADKLIEYYRLQRTAVRVAPARLYGESYDFGLALMKRARREPNTIAGIQTAIANDIRLQQLGAGIGPATQDGGSSDDTNLALNSTIASEPEEAAKQRNDQDKILTLIGAVDELAEGVPNLALIVNGLTLCRTNALAGEDLPRPQIQFSGQAI